MKLAAYAAARANPAESLLRPRATNVDFLLLRIGRTCRCGSDWTGSNRLRMSAISGACVKTHRPRLVEEQIPAAANSAQEWRLTQSSDLTSTSLDTTLLHSNKFCLERESRAAVASRAQPSRYLGRRKPSLQFSVRQRFHTGSLLSRLSTSTVLTRNPGPISSIAPLVDRPLIRPLYTRKRKGVSRSHAAVPLLSHPGHRDRRGRRRA